MRTYRPASRYQIQALHEKQARMYLINMRVPTAVAIVCFLGHASAFSNPLARGQALTHQKTLKRSPTAPDPGTAAGSEAPLLRRTTLPPRTTLSEPNHPKLSRRELNAAAASLERWHGSPELPLPPKEGHSSGKLHGDSSAFQQHLDELDRLSSVPSSPRSSYGGSPGAGARVKGFDGHVQRIKAGRHGQNSARPPRWY